MNEYEIFKKELISLGKEGYAKEFNDYFNGQKERYLGNFKIIHKYLNKKDRILEVGCFPSFFLVTLKRAGYDVEGVDVDPQRDGRFVEKEKLNIKKCDVERDRLPYHNKTFDKVILSEVFEHLYVDPIFTINEINRVLKNKALILTTPNGYSLKRIVIFLRGGGLGENPFEEFNKLTKIGHRGHIREYSCREIGDF